jgi:hypothetical protein
VTYKEKASHTLRHGTATEKATALLSISQWKEVPEDILEQIDGLRDDRSVARMYAPFRYGEIAYLATRIHALLRCRRGLRETVIARGTVIPLKGERLSKLCEENQILMESDDPADWFMALRERGLLEVVDEPFDERSFDLDE